MSDPSATVDCGVESVYTGVWLFLPDEVRPVNLQPGKHEEHRLYQSAVATAMLCNNHYKIAAGCREKYSFRRGICRSTCLSSCLWPGHVLGTWPENKLSHIGTCPGCGYGAPANLPLAPAEFHCCSKSLAQPGIQKVRRAFRPVTAGSCEALGPLVDPRHLPRWLLMRSSTCDPGPEAKFLEQSHLCHLKVVWLWAGASLCTPRLPPLQPQGEQASW